MGDPDGPKAEARRKLMGRLMIVLLALLVAAYVVPMLM